MSLNFNENVTQDKVYCVKCLKKNPPVKTVLVEGVNWRSSHRKKRTNYCKDCTNKIERHAEKRRQKLRAGYDSVVSKDLQQRLLKLSERDHCTPNQIFEALLNTYENIGQLSEAVESIVRMNRVADVLRKYEPQLKKLGLD